MTKYALTGSWLRKTALLLKAFANNAAEAFSLLHHFNFI